MAKYIKAPLLVILPILFWVAVISTGYGAQSLSQLIEIPIVIVVSIIIAAILWKKKFHEILGVIFVFVILLRIIMPSIPE